MHKYNILYLMSKKYFSHYLGLHLDHSLYNYCLAHIDSACHQRATPVELRRVMAVPYTYEVETSFTVFVIPALVGSKVISKLFTICLIAPIHINTAAR